MVRKLRKERRMENKIEYPENLILEIAGTGYYHCPCHEEIEYAIEHFEENWPYFIEQVSKTHSSAERCGKITIKHYRDHKTLKDLGKEYGLSQERIRQMMQILICRARTNYYRPILFAGKGLMEAVETCKEKYERLLAEYEKKIADIQNGQDVEEIKKHRYETDISDLDLSIRTHNCLRRAGLNTLGKIEDYLREHNYSYDCLAVIRNMGKKSAKELIERLAEYGIKVQ
jgi:hypothetical protein